MTVNDQIWERVERLLRDLASEPFMATPEVTAEAREIVKELEA